MWFLKRTSTVPSTLRLPDRPIQPFPQPVFGIPGHSGATLSDRSCLNLSQTNVRPSPSADLNPLSPSRRRIPAPVRPAGLSRRSRAPPTARLGSDYTPRSGRLICWRSISACLTSSESPHGALIMPASLPMKNSARSSRKAGTPRPVLALKMGNHRIRGGEVAELPNPMASAGTDPTCLANSR